jgi:hypothetical protein
VIALLIAGAIIKNVDFPDDSLDKARQYEIASRTILDDYNDRQETLKYLLSLFITPLLSLGLFSLTHWVFRRHTHAGTDVSLNGEPREIIMVKHFRKRQVLFQYVLPALLVVYITYDGSFVTRWFNLTNLMIDESCHLAWINEIFTGKVLYKDTFYLYGPLITYPAAFAMWMVGLHISVWRFYILWSAILGFLIIFYSLFAFRLSGLARWTAFIFIIVFSYPVLPSLSWVSLRVGLGFLAMALYAAYVSRNKALTLVLSGTVSALAMFYSQEIGFAVIMAIGLCLLLQNVNQFDPKRSLIRLGFFSLGMVPIIFLVLLFFFLNNALWEFLSGFIEGPRYLFLGWAALPFPNLTIYISYLINHMSWQTCVMFIKYMMPFYFPILLYLGLLSYYVIKLLFKQFHRGDLAYFCLLAFGILLFRSPLARSDEVHLLFACLPVVILSIKVLDHLVLQPPAGKWNRVLISLPIGATIAIGLFSLCMTREAHVKFLTIKNRLTGNRPYFLEDPRHPNPYQPLSAFESLKSDRGEGLMVPRHLRRSMDAVVTFITNNTDPHEPIFAYPNASLFYFLTGRPNATSRVLSHMMITKHHRQDVVSQLILNKPRYIIFGRLPRVDLIPLEMESPEVLKYIEQNYKIVNHHGRFDVYERVSG